MSLMSCSQVELMAGLRAASEAEALFTEEEWLRRYQYKQSWSPGVDFASFSNGGGDDIFVLSSSDGVIVKGFDHESDVTPYGNDDHRPWPGMFDGVPDTLLKLLEDEAVAKDDVTFLQWLPSGQTEWQRGSVSFPNSESDGTEWLLEMLPLSAKDYIETARDYYSEDFDQVDLDSIKALFKQ